MRKITAVLFDWDYTLGRILGDVPNSERIARLLERQGLRYSTDEVQVAIERRQEHIDRGEMDGSLVPQTVEDVARFYQQILSLLGHHETSREFATHLYRDFGRLPTVMYEDSLDVLRSLAQDGFILGIISNNSASARENMERIVGGLIPPEHIVISEEAGVHKPDKAIFLRGASQVGADPRNCLYVGDNLEVDAIAAVREGGYAYGLWIDRNEKGADLELPARVVHIASLYEVAAFVRTGEI
jgi:HAD superfamily hydrolase (TIGR01549 family)